MGCLRLSSRSLSVFDIKEQGQGMEFDGKKGEHFLLAGQPCSRLGPVHWVDGHGRVFKYANCKYTHIRD